MTQLEHVLIAEDSDGDFELIKLAMKVGRVQPQIRRVVDGEQTLEFLFRQGEYHSAPKPQMILLDLNLPKKSGREILKIVKSEAILEDIPVVVFTGSSSDREQTEVFRLGAQSFVRKPRDFKQFCLKIQEVMEFWLT